MQKSLFLLLAALFADTVQLNLMPVERKTMLCCEVLQCHFKGLIFR